jgi:hypothetical protein
LISHESYYYTKNMVTKLMNTVTANTANSGDSPIRALKSLSLALALFFPSASLILYSYSYSYIALFFILILILILYSLFFINATGAIVLITIEAL